MHTFCLKLGGLASLSATQCGGRQINGPKQGKDFAGGAFSAFAEASASVGPVGIGGDASINTEDPSQKSFNGCIGRGGGADLGRNNFV